MGHEAAGIIAGVGPQVTEWRVGERVTFDSTVYCGGCEHCRRGEVNLCHHRRVLGVSCAEYSQPGAFAEYVVVPERILYRLPEALSFEEAALVEPFTIAFHAVRRRPPQLNDSALIVGCGMIGLALLQTARLAGFGQIVAVDTSADRLLQAKALGADEVVNTSEARGLERLLELTKGRGFDHVFEAVGVEATIDLAVRAVRKGGCVTLVGNVTPTVVLPLQLVVTRELTLYGSCASAGEYRACLDMMVRGAITVKPLLSAVAPLAEGASWFKRLYNREAGLLKVILVP
jgi:threonine dehydrogenase-like Zn-dependent dehydrogenase